jgi:hypothetical protein
MKKIFLLLIAASAFIFTGCRKTGPMGPQGPAGPQGPQGNANVIGSDPFTVTSWTYESGINMYTATFSSSDITPAIVDFGIVSVFKNYGTTSNPDWTPLPDVNDNISTVFNFHDGGFKIYVQSTDGSTPPAPGAVTFRMVVISSSLKQAHPNTNWNDYNQVMQAMNSSAANAKM